MVAAKMFQRGVGPYEVGCTLDVTHCAASQWKIALEEGGIEALMSKPNLGDTSRMTDEQRFGISYETSHVSRILKRLGFSPQKPERRAREQDEAAVSQWRFRDWVRINKKPAAKE